jgi:NAD(P)-dependent dehydrogenase (short-subunit alcohol dehydrogenase family)
MELQGAVAIVTGGNGGLGQRICHALAQAGRHIVTRPYRGLVTVNRGVHNGLDGRVRW